MAGRVIEYLERQGPSPAAALPDTVTTRARSRGVRSFDLRANANGGAHEAMGGNSTTIYYLERHPPVAVLRTWVEANQQFVERSTQRRFTRKAGAHGSQWREAARSIGAEYFDAEAPYIADGERESITCPLCGTVVSELPAHLEGGCEHG